MVRVWEGDFVDLPVYQGTFDVVFMNAVFGNFFDQRLALIKAVTMMKPGLEGTVMTLNPANGERALLSTSIS